MVTPTRVATVLVLLAACAQEKPAHTGSAPAPGTTAAGTSTATTGLPAGATTSSGTPAGTTPGTTTTVPPAGCPPPLPVPDDLCDLALVNPAILDDYQPIDPTLAVFCHTPNGDSYLVVEGNLAMCNNHAPHPMDLLPACRC